MQCQDEELLHELLVTARQETKIRNLITNSMLIDIKLSKAQLSKIIQSGGFLGLLLDKLAAPLMKVGVPLAKNIFNTISCYGMTFCKR